MSTVWYCIPSARPKEEAMTCLSKWMDLGYGVAVYRDGDAETLPVDLCVHGPYGGYAKAVNHLASLVLADPEVGWVVSGGDDVLPDPDHDPAEIAEQCERFFKGTLGVMQPVGHRYGVDAHGRCAAERVCVSPWMGREWAERAYEGMGPLWPGYRHEWVDEDLHEVALKHGKLHHDPNIRQVHNWYGLRGEPVPPHLRNKSKWNEAGKKLFQQRKAAGFPHSGFSIA